MRQSSNSTVTQTVEDVGETQESKVCEESKVCALTNVKDSFKVLFSGNQFAVENAYFEKVCNSVHTLFDV